LQHCGLTDDRRAVLHGASIQIPNSSPQQNRFDC
jgi:hypothetical protein